MLPFLRSSAGAHTILLKGSLAVFPSPWKTVAPLPLKHLAETPPLPPLDVS